MPVAESPEVLRARKEDLFAAIRQLDQDREDGLIDDSAYRSSRQRYEEEAAGILAQLEALETQPSARKSSAPVPDRRSRSRRQTVAGMPRLLALVAAGLAVLAIVLFLVGAVRQRTGTQSITGDVGATTPVPQTSARIQAAERAVLAHPNSADARLALGTAYLDDGQVAAADETYQIAMRLAPHRPEPKTLDALALGSIGQTRRALALLPEVERQHPRYSRAWLLDGLLSSRMVGGRARSIAAWQRFLVVDPHNNLAPRVRVWLKREAKVRSQNG